jgi:hypothetical protein
VLMFTAADRDLVMQRLLDLARADPVIAGAAIKGSLATGSGDRWSDIDLAFGVSGPLGAAMQRWTAKLYRDFGALHHWDLAAGQSTYRVFLLPGWLEADIAFMPAADFGPGGPAWRTMFACIARDRFWQAEYWISGLRDLVLALACARLGYPASYGKGAHLLPADLTEPLQAALVASLDPVELRRALAAAATALGEELDRADSQLASRLLPLLRELAGAAN